MKRISLNWYERLSVADRQAVDAIAKWLRPIPWQSFLTITFAWNVRAETAEKKFRRFINDLERHHRAKVCIVAGQESKPREHGMNVPNHFHLLLASHAPLSAEAIRALWLAQVTSRPRQGRNDECVRVEPYNEHERGAEYCLKSVNDAHGDWLVHRLREFLPGAPGPGKPNHRSVRGARRDREQIARFAGN